MSLDLFPFYSRLHWIRFQQRGYRLLHPSSIHHNWLSLILHLTFQLTLLTVFHLSNSSEVCFSIYHVWDFLSFIKKVTTFKNAASTELIYGIFALLSGVIQCHSHCWVSTPSIAVRVAGRSKIPQAKTRGFFQDKRIFPYDMKKATAMIWKQWEWISPLKTGDRMETLGAPNLKSKLSPFL